MHAQIGNLKSEIPAGFRALVVLVPEVVAERLAEYGAPHDMSGSELAAETLTEKWAPHLVELGPASSGDFAVARRAA